MGHARMMDIPSRVDRAVEAALLILIEKRLGSTRVARERHLVGSDQEARPLLRQVNLVIMARSSVPTL